MKAGGASLALLLLAASPAVSQTDARLVAFHDICLGDVAGGEDFRPAAVAGGWQPARDDVNSALGLALTSIRQMRGDPPVALETYAKPALGAAVFLILADARSQADGEGASTRAVACSLCDFDATAPVAPEAISAWLQSEPTRAVDDPEALVGRIWAATFASPVAPRSSMVTSSYVPEGSPLAASLDFSNVELKRLLAP